MDKADGITYDKRNRIQYHPDFHPNQGKRYTLDELIYLCKFYETDGSRSMSFALGKTEAMIEIKVQSLKSSGQYEYYKNMDDETWERILSKEKRDG